MSGSPSPAPSTGSRSSTRPPWVRAPWWVPSPRRPTSSDPAARPCPTRDVERAKELLAEAGFADGLTIGTIVSQGEYATSVNEAQNIQAQLADAGITLDIETMEIGAYVDRWLAADFQTAVALNGGRPDPDVMYGRYFTSTGNLNTVAGYSSPELDELFAAGKSTSDVDARRAIYDQISRHLEDNAVWVWLFSSYAYTATVDGVSGFVPDAQRVAPVPADDHARLIDRGPSTFRGASSRVPRHRAPVGRRVVETGVTLFGVAVLVFVMLRVIPGDQIDRVAGHRDRRPHARPSCDALRAYYGIDQPVIDQFLGWLTSLLSGNLGVSQRTGQSVFDMTASSLPVTIELAILATLLGLLIGIPLATALRIPTQQRP